MRDSAKSKDKMDKKAKQHKPPPQKQIKKKQAGKVDGPAIKEHLDKLCQANRLWILIAIIVVSAVFRIVYFNQLHKTHLLNEHIHSESDMVVFDEWARDIAKGDLLSRDYIQPEHGWMKWIANRYFKDNPDKLTEYQRIAGPDSTKNTPVKAIWTHWYGKDVFPHEPFYAYFLALNYKVFGHDVSWVFIWQLILGIITNVLIYLITRRYFGDFAACIAALMAIFFGPLMFYEMVLLRSTMAVFCGLLVTWLLGTALEKNTLVWWILGGVATGLFMMVHGYVVLFLFTWILFLGIRFFREKRSLMVSVGGYALGTLLTISPVMLRNSIVHAPLMSMSNNSAIGFITMNDKPFKNYLGWNVDLQISSDIMGQSDGKLIKAIIPTLKTHGSVISYVKLLLEKLQATFSWYEIQNNVNFYFYRELIPVLRWTFLSFLVLAPLAIAGIFLSFVKKNHPWPLYLMLLTYLAAMLGFMVLSRYRIVFTGVLIPFAAYSVAELFGRWKGWTNWVMIAGIAILGFWCSGPSTDEVSTVGKSDYMVFWTIHYFPEISQASKTGHFVKTEAMFRDFIARYEPGYLRDLPPYYHCKTKDESEIFGFFADVHGNLSGLYNFVGKRDSGQREADITTRLKTAAGL